MRVGLGRAPCGSGGVCASWATRGVSRPGGEGKRGVALGPLRVGLGCELGFLFWVCAGLSWVWVMGSFSISISFLFLIQTKFEFK